MIRTTEYCDQCEKKLGEAHPDAVIKVPEGCSIFPQLIWTFCRKGLQLLKNQQSGAPVLQDKYFISSNKQELCEKHGLEFNILLKAYGLGDYRINKILDDLKTEDAKYWSDKNDEVRSEHAHSLQEYKKKQGALNGDGDRKHSQGGDHRENRAGDNSKARGGNDTE